MDKNGVWRDYGPFRGMTSKDLSLVELTSEQKAWLGEQALNGERGATNAIALAFNLVPKTIYKYKGLIEKGIQPQGANGRPPALDERAKSELDSKVEIGQRYKIII